MNKKSSEIELERLKRFVLDRDQFEPRSQKLSSLVNGLDKETLSF